MDKYFWICEILVDLHLVLLNFEPHLNFKMAKVSNLKINERSNVKRQNLQESLK